MNIAVVALGKIGLPLAVQFARKGHQVVGVDVNPRTVDLVNAGHASRSRARPTSPSGWPSVVAGGLLTRDHRQRRRRARTPRPSSSWSRCSSTRTASRTSAGWTPPPATRRAACSPGTLVVLRDHAAGRHHAQPLRRRCSRRARASTAGTDFHLVFSPERVLTGRVFADLRRYPKLVGGIDERERRARRRVLRGGARLRRAARPRPRPTASGTSAAPRPPSWPSSPRRPTATSTSAWPTSSRGSPPTHGIDVLPGHRGVATPSRTATSTARASPSAATASRSTRGCTCGTTRRPPSSAPRARPTPTMPDVRRRRCSRAPTAT